MTYEIHQKSGFIIIGNDDSFRRFFSGAIPRQQKIRIHSGLGRYDYMSDHNRGGVDNLGNLKTDDPSRHRLTGGITLGMMGRKSLQADIRLNFEQYFYRKDVVPAISERNKIIAEFVVHF